MEHQSAQKPFLQRLKYECPLWYSTLTQNYQLSGDHYCSRAGYTFWKSICAINTVEIMEYCEAPSAQKSREQPRQQRMHAAQQCPDRENSNPKQLFGMLTAGKNYKRRNKKPAVSIYCLKRHAKQGSSNACSYTQPRSASRASVYGNMRLSEFDPFLTRNKTRLNTQSRRSKDCAARWASPQRFFYRR